jgi:hypothetical protein
VKVGRLETVVEDVTETVVVKIAAVKNVGKAANEAGKSNSVKVTMKRKRRESDDVEEEAVKNAKPKLDN